MSWAQRRRATYLGGIFLFIFIILIIFAIYFFSRKATCSDGLRNQGEAGIDCGGPCVNLCRAEYSDPNILWVRWAKVLSSGTYNVLAYVENPNLDAGAYDVPYNFKIYDKSDVLLFEKSGTTYIPPSKNFAIFEDSIDVEDKIPARISFAFSNNNLWQKIASKELDLASISKNLSKEDSKPRLDVSIKNKSLQSIKNIEVVAILYDIDDNAIAFSRTKIDSVVGDGTQNIVFTWPEPLSGKVYRIEIVPKVLSK